MINREDIPLIKNILNINNDNIDTKLLYDVISIVQEDPSRSKDLLDSFSSNQVASKYALLNAVDNLNFLDNDSTVVIWGSWYGSILIPELANKVKKIISIDLDETPLQIAKNRLFANYKNIEYVCDDVGLRCLECKRIFNGRDCGVFYHWGKYGCPFCDNLEDKIKNEE